MKVHKSMKLYKTLILLGNENNRPQMPDLPEDCVVKEFPEDPEEVTAGEGIVYSWLRVESLDIRHTDKDEFLSTEENDLFPVFYASARKSVLRGYYQASAGSRTGEAITVFGSFHLRYKKENETTREEYTSISNYRDMVKRDRKLER